MRSHLPHRKDANHGEVKSALERVGFVVWDTHMVGGGFPDMVAARSGLTFLVEIKTPTGKLNDDQVKFIARWSGRVEILTGVDDVIALVKRFVEQERAP
jgi:Holliday junction resolvase